MSIEGLYEKYGDKYILNHQDGNRYVRWGKIEKDLDTLISLKEKLRIAVEKLENLHGHGLAKQQFPHKDDLNFREALYEAGKFLEGIRAK